MAVEDNALIKLLRLGHMRFEHAKYERLAEGIDENVVWHTPGDHPLSGTIVGLDAVFEWLRKSAEVTDGTFRAEIHNIATDDSLAAVVSTYRGERKGMTLVMPGVQTFRFDPVSNKVVEARIWVYDDVFVNKFWSA
ncbi:nuclear transport factor 2 family protein [Actinocrinis puniceicyclus]|uniref:Nuclear transport factor 2 family protein n=1 Tax=Actinocrinis puniceicyclus TaxID=977794 RepID=A0A8J7WME7_9ACTN|nr:nuclear transport factor 2 family protein [Actinocrinis puniceicyclus]MBS2962357.1 nuclear transport factor 2 family protein [Actinocrinis puniceicyclus]